MGQLGDGSDAYEQALAIYRETNDPLTDNYEQEHGWLIAYVGRLVDETSHDIEEFRDAKHRSTLTEWLAYKRDHLPELLDKLETKDEWNSDESP